MGAKILQRNADDAFAVTQQRNAAGVRFAFQRCLPAAGVLDLGLAVAVAQRAPHVG